MTVTENKTGSRGTGNPTVLCVCLNGTLVATDTLWESVFRLIRLRPLFLVVLPVWLARGKIWFRHRMAQAIVLDPSCLPYREKVIAYLRSQKTAGRHLMLATCAHHKVACAVADYLGLFDDVLASDEHRNLANQNKLAAIRSYVNGGRFEFVCNGRSDRAVIKATSRLTLVGPQGSITAQKRPPRRQLGGLSEPLNRIKAVIVSLRVHHWTKSFLLLVPLIFAHQWSHIDLLGKLLVAMACFSIAASSIYIINDLFDLPADRAHPIKAKRPLAAGELDVPTAFGIAIMLLVAATFVAHAVLPKAFFWVLSIYITTAIAYSIHLKHRLVLDVIVLAALYTLRIFAGGAAVGISVSAWLSAFSMFFFLSLAFAKRYAELDGAKGHREQGRPHRPYMKGDLGVFRSAGPSCGLLSVLVLALYLNSPTVRALYRYPHALWLLCPVLLYWILRIWLLTLRERVYDDPVILALRDPASYVVGGLVLLVLVMAI